MLQGKVKAIGEEALASTDPMMILFGEDASEMLKQVSVVQSLSLPNDYKFTKESQVVFGDETYQVNYVGGLVQENFQELGHTVFVFQEVPKEDILENAVYLSPYKLPEISIDTTILYK